MGRAWLAPAQDPDRGSTPPSEVAEDPPLVQVRVDGKAVRGAKAADGSQVHLLAALAGQHGVVAAQAAMSAKTNEIPMIIPLLDGLDLSNAVITADALHCQRVVVILRSGPASNRPGHAALARR